VLLAGAGAEAFARERGLLTVAPEHFVTARQRQRWATHPPAPRPMSGGVVGGGSGDPGTVGAVAADRLGHVAAATSTGGLMGKLPGRIGDSAILGAGTYADDEAGAASATGVGEAIILAGLARAAVVRLRGGRAPESVAAETLRELIARAPHAAAGLILVDRFGRCAWAHEAEHMSSAVRCAP
jgi:beta-aspartyl-peptidase (threonine type)